MTSLILGLALLAAVLWCLWRLLMAQPPHDRLDALERRLSALEARQTPKPRKP